MKGGGACGCETTIQTVNRITAAVATPKEATVESLVSSLSRGAATRPALITITASEGDAAALPPPAPALAAAKPKVAGKVVAGSVATLLTLAAYLTARRP